MVRPGWLCLLRLCPIHVQKLIQAATEMLTMQESTKCLGEGNSKSGWKSIYSFGWGALRFNQNKKENRRWYYWKGFWEKNVDWDFNLRGPLACFQVKIRWIMKRSLCFNILAFLTCDAFNQTQKTADATIKKLVANGNWSFETSMEKATQWYWGNVSFIFETKTKLLALFDGVDLNESACDTENKPKTIWPQ